MISSGFYMMATLALNELTKQNYTYVASFNGILLLWNYTSKLVVSYS